MHLVEIEGPREVLAGLRGMTGVIVTPSHAEQIGPDRWKVGGYASDAAIAKLEARGCRVVVHLDEQERSDRLRALWEAKNQRPPGEA